MNSYTEEYQRDERVWKQGAEKSGPKTEAEEECIMKSAITCALQQILLV
jgi:hypothetical protein